MERKNDKEKIGRKEFGRLLHARPPSAQIQITGEGTCDVSSRPAYDDEGRECTALNIAVHARPEADRVKEKKGIDEDKEEFEKWLDKNKVCLLEDPRVIIAPHNPGEPPSWAPSLPGDRIFWVDRDVFDALIARRHDKPCDICPSEIKEQCNEAAQRSEAKK